MYEVNSQLFSDLCKPFNAKHVMKFVAYQCSTVQCNTMLLSTVYFSLV